MLTDYFQNLLRVFLFAFMVGIVFAILGLMTSYSIHDTILRSTIFEERIFNALEKNPPPSFEEITPQYLSNIITGDEELPKEDVIAFRLRFIDPASKKEVKIRSDGKEIKYDADVFTQDPADSMLNKFYPATGNVKSNRESVISAHALQDPKTKKVYVVQFEFRAGRN